MRIPVVLPDETECEPNVTYMAEHDEWQVEMLFRSSAVCVRAPTLEQAVRKFVGGLLALRHEFVLLDAGEEE